MHKNHKHFIPELDVFENIDSDMEFRSLCSQKLAKAFVKGYDTAIDDITAQFNSEGDE